MGGRIDQIAVYEQKHPAILPYKSHVSKLIVRHYHALAHQERGYMINKIRLQQKVFETDGDTNIFNRCTSHCI